MTYQRNHSRAAAKASIPWKWLEARQIQAVIPPRSHRLEQRSCDGHLYKERHLIECLFGKLKHYRRIATRYEKKASHFQSMLTFAAALLWLR